MTSMHRWPVPILSGEDADEHAYDFNSISSLCSFLIPEPLAPDVQASLSMEAPPAASSQAPGAHRSSLSPCSHLLLAAAHLFRLRVTNVPPERAEWGGCRCLTCQRNTHTHKRELSCLLLVGSNTPQSWLPQSPSDRRVALSGLGTDGVRALMLSWTTCGALQNTGGTLCLCAPWLPMLESLR